MTAIPPTSPPELILASQSPYRRAQLEQMGLTFVAQRPKVDEEELKRDGPVDLFELTRYLALHKAESLRADFPHAIILGSDQIAECEGERLDKPGTREKAALQLSRLQGKTHRLITSLVVAAPHRIQTFTDVTEIELEPLNAQDISAYLDLDQPFDCAGSYKIERAGMALVRRLQSQDPSAIQGLPTLSLWRALRHLQITLPQLWPNHSQRSPQ